MVTGKQIADTTLEAIKCNGGYIWGQQGATWTAAKQENLEKRYNADPSGQSNYKYSALYGKKWIGHRVWDCAGLCRWAASQHGIAIHSGSNLIWRNDLSKKGALTAGMQLPVGALVFTGDKENSHPHIGTYTGDGLVTEAAGTKEGCIQSKLTNSKWRWWGLEKGVEYEFTPGSSSAPATQKPADQKQDTSTKLPTIRKGNKGAVVKQMQQMLDKLGYDLGICGVDGDYGTSTEKAVREFQRDHGLTQDGVCGPKTWAALQEAVDKIGTKPAPAKTYSAVIDGLTEAQAQAIKQAYPNAVIKEVDADA